MIGARARVAAAGEYLAGWLSYLIAPWAVADRTRTAHVRLSQRIRFVEDYIMAADRDLTRKILTALPVILTSVQGLITRQGELVAENVAQRAEIAQLKGEAATDEQADAAELQPLSEGVDTLLALVQPAAEQAPDVTPAETVEEVPAVIAEDPRPDVDPAPSAAAEVPTDPAESGSTDQV